MIKTQKQLSEEAYSKGIREAQQGNYESAIDYFDEAIRLKSSLAEAYLNRAAVNSKLGRYSEAWADYEQALKYDETLDMIVGQAQQKMLNNLEEELKIAKELLKELEERESNVVDLEETEAL